MKLTTAICLLWVLGGVAVAQDTRELGAHEHGHATLDIALDGDSVAMLLEAPGADITGFEYAPESDGDRALVDAAIASLSDPLALFVPPAAAGCTTASAQVDLEMEGSHSAFHATYTLVCSDADVLDSLAFAYFDSFAGAQEVEVQIVGGSGAGAAEVTRDAPVLDLTALR